MAYEDLGQYLDVLEQRGMLRRVSCEVDREWEIAAVCRAVFQRPERERYAIMFERVKGSPYPLVAGVLGASREVYALALECKVKEIMDRWETALQNLVEPDIVQAAPCQEVILQGEDIVLNKFPIPTWTVGEDPGPYLTSPYVCSKDPETGIRNVGTYRLQVKSANRTGIFVFPTHHMYAHMQKNERAGKSTPVAVAIGTDPVVGLCSVASIPRNMDEFAVAGALRRQPVQLVKCKTVDLEVPATAEIIIEGEIPPNHMEEEGPFGEYTGYMGPAGQNPIINVKCITHRRNPIYQAFVSQMPPSESSIIRGTGHDLTLLKHLKVVLGLPVMDVYHKESGGGAAYLVISMQKEHPGQPKQVIWGAWGYDPSLGKITVVVDNDIDVRDDFAVDWALSFRMQPAKDVFILDRTHPVELDPSLAGTDIPQHLKYNLLGSKIGIDATRKHAFPAKAVPPDEHLQRVRNSWARYGL